MNNQPKNRVIDWIVSGMDYTTGVELYSSLGRNKVLLAGFARKEKTKARKLCYELCKSVGIDFNRLDELIAAHCTDRTEQDFKISDRSGLQNSSENNTPFAGSSFNSTDESGPTYLEETSPGETLEDFTDPEKMEAYPPVIRRIIHEYAELFQERSRTHAAMAGMPYSNADSVMTRRAELFDQVKSLSARLEQLWSARKTFEEKGILPEADQLWPTEQELPTETSQQKMPEDVESLKRMKKNLQTANSKDQTLLDYQSKEQAENKMPMPEGPKRLKIESRIRERVRKIDEIELILLNKTIRE